MKQRLFQMKLFSYMSKYDLKFQLYPEMIVFVKTEETTETPFHFDVAREMRMRFFVTLELRLKCVVFGDYPTDFVNIKPEFTSKERLLLKKWIVTEGL